MVAGGTLQRHMVIGLSLLAFCVVARLVPHLPNATPLVAVAFVSSMYLTRYYAVLLPLGALLVSDMMIGLYDWRIMLSVYGSYLLISGISWIGSSRQNSFRTASAVIMSGVLFFFITNAAVWAFSPWYEKSLPGLLYAYELGLPFLRNMVFGDLFYTGVLVSAFELVRILQPSARTSVQKRFGNDLGHETLRISQCK